MMDLFASFKSDDDDDANQTARLRCSRAPTTSVVSRVGVSSDDLTDSDFRFQIRDDDEDADADADDANEDDARKTTRERVDETLPANFRAVEAPKLGRAATRGGVCRVGKRNVIFCLGRLGNADASHRVPLRRDGIGRRGRRREVV
jgi:hypothetical protein